MRTHAALAATLAVALLAVSLTVAVRSARAASLPPPRLFVELQAGAVGANPRFLPVDTNGETDVILGRLPTVVNLTILNEPGVSHTFTIASTAANAPSPNLINIDLPSTLPANTRRSVEFTVWASDKLQIGSRNETAETDRGGIKFFCIPHKALGMDGRVLVGGVTQTTEEPAKGVFLRAYWIGLLGIAGTMLLVVISYFVIKSGSRHYTDHHEHIRRGGP